jgi:hypothetical protein
MHDPSTSSDIFNKPVLLKFNRKPYYISSQIYILFIRAIRIIVLESHINP